MTREQIARQLGVTTAGLELLERLAGEPSKEQGGFGAATEFTSITRLAGGGYLSRDLLDGSFQITRDGRDLLQRAKEMGWER